MAFENVFRGIDWQAGERDQARQQNMLMNALGQAVAREDKLADRDVKRRQLEQKANQDYQQLAMDEVNRQAQGLPPTQRGQAAIKVMAQTKADQMYIDPMSGQQVVKPNPYKNLGGQFGNVLGGQPSQAPLNMGMVGGQSQQSIPQLEIDAGGNITDPRQGALIPRDVVSDDRFVAGKEFGAKGKLKELDVSADVAKEELKGAAREKQEIEKKMREAKRPAFEAMEGITPTKEDVKKMTESTVARKVLGKLINKQRNIIEKYGVSVSGTEGARAIDRGMAKITMQIKNMEELGALQAPDIELVNRMTGSAVFDAGDVANPVSGVTQIRQGKEIALQSLEEFDEYIDDNLRANAESRGFKLNLPERKPKEPKEDKPVSYKDYF